MDDFQARSAAQSLTEHLVGPGALSYFELFEQILACLYLTEVDLSRGMRVRRLIAAAVRSKLRQQQALIDAQLQAIALCEEEPVDAARLHQAMLEVFERVPAAQYQKNWSRRAAVIVASLDTEDERDAFRNAVHNRDFVESDGRYEFPTRVWRLIAAIAGPVALLAYYMCVAYLISRIPSVDRATVVGVIIALIGLSAWAAWLSIRSAVRTRALHARISSPTFGKALIKV